MGESIRVLHVDDEPDFAGLAAEFLQRQDERFRIETATSATEGLDRLSRNGVNCIVSDYDMPGRTGIEFLEAVRDDHPEIPFILFTGKGSEEIASRAISAGVTDYLQKEAGTEQYAVLANGFEMSSINAELRPSLNGYGRISRPSPGVSVTPSSRSTRTTRFSSQIRVSRACSGTHRARSKVSH